MAAPTCCIPCAPPAVAAPHKQHTLSLPGQVYPHGSTDSLPYCTMGSGSLNAMAVFEVGIASWQQDRGSGCTTSCPSCTDAHA